MTSNPAQKELKVKSGVVKRLAKELAAYKKEYEHQQSRIDKMKAENADSYDIKKQVEVLGETEMMIPNCKKRLEAAYNDLQLFLKTHQLQVSDATLISEANDALQLATPALSV